MSPLPIPRYSIYPVSSLLTFQSIQSAKETTGLASVQPSSATPLAQSSCERNSCDDDNLRRTEAAASGCPAPAATDLGMLESRGTSLLGS